ncbi:MAG: sigma 54-interacting transcriptional regulator [Smithellaceae bacterium]|nr:sigma 54-interacting transcriptional regulator [Syntrophaceae bacterium]MDD4241430.1 sigma 54-interacting transcriptional regulator [Smithellaceae bacterium]
MDDQRFFHEMTLRICGSLDIDAALWQCFLFLRKTFPLDTMFLNIFDLDLGIVETIARADATGGHVISAKTILPESARSFFADVLTRAEKAPYLYTVARMRDHITGLHVSATLGIQDSGALVIFPKLTHQTLGAVILTNRAGRPYSGEHVRLLELLNEPFGIAISNYSRFREISRLRDILEEENRYLSEDLHKQIGEEIIGDSFGLKTVMDMVRQVAPLSSPVLLLGETGVGKEVVANAIHKWSPRRGGPFIKVNCGAIPDTLVDSELFGHEKGAFTGAVAQKRGRFERAHRGTIFLDEIGDLPTGAQTRLLRILQEKEFERVGGSETLKADVRVIAATHRNLEAMIADGRFREDLYFRIRVFPISIPPLRDRISDIPAFIHYFIHKKAKEMSLAHIPPLAPGALNLLTRYKWPGNVRELQNAVERELIVHGGQPLSFSNLISPAPQQVASSREPPSALDSLNSAVSRHIVKAMETTGGKIEGPNGAARLLEINPSTLRKKMKKLGIPFGRNTPSAKKTPHTETKEKNRPGG